MPEKGLLPEGWERSETQNGIPYFVNHHTEQTQWEHPRLTSVLRELDGLNDIRYAAYRTAMKLRALQKTIQLNMVHLDTIEQIFSEMGLGEMQNSEVLQVIEIEGLLSKLFTLAHHKLAVLNPEECIDVCVSWLLKCLDSGRTGLVNIGSLKVIIAAMCSSPIEDKYRYMFKVTAGGHTGISYSSLTALLNTLMLLPQHLMEGDSFHSESMESATVSCWSSARIIPNADLSISHFLSWMLSPPICLVWLPTMHRISSAETVKHDSKCNICKTFPIIGLRYRCLKCSNMDLCQNCFWTQRTKKNHKTTHPFKEYCLETTTGDDVRDFAAQIKNKLMRSYRHRPPKKNYIDYPHSNVKKNMPTGSSKIFQEVHSHIDEMALHLRELEVVHDEADDPLGSEHLQLSTQVPNLQLKTVIAECHEPTVHEGASSSFKVPSPEKGLVSSAAKVHAKALEKHNVTMENSVMEAWSASPFHTTKIGTTSKGVNTLPLTPNGHDQSLMIGKEQDALKDMVDTALHDLILSTDVSDHEESTNGLFAAAENVGKILGSIVNSVEKFLSSSHHLDSSQD